MAFGDEGGGYGCQGGGGGFNSQGCGGYSDGEEAGLESGGDFFGGEASFRADQRREAGEGVAGVKRLDDAAGGVGEGYQAELFRRPGYEGLEIERLGDVHEG